MAGNSSYEQSEFSESEDEPEFRLHGENVATSDTDEKGYGDIESDCDNSDIIVHWRQKAWCIESDTDDNANTSKESDDWVDIIEDITYPLEKNFQ